jgi:OOP family OmpA-OmpF porin
MAVYVTSSDSGRWRVPVRVNLGAASTGAGNPMISPDGKVLLVTMRQPGSEVDIMYSCRMAGGWTSPRALPPPVTSPRGDFAPAIDASGTTLYFTSERPGIVPALPDSVRPPGDIYRIPLRDAGIDCR